MKEIVVLYSGGTDSTCTAALMAERFDKVHLLTFDRFGLFSVTNSKVNVKRLKDKFGENKFTHKIINVDRLFKKVSYSKYLYNFIKYRFLLLSTCGLCKLAMHIRSLIYCLENNINQVCDGANKNMPLFPAQMIEVINEIKNMYSRYGISYSIPVFEFNQPKNIGYLDRINPKILQLQVFEHKSDYKNPTAGEILFKMGIFPAKNVKGTKIDRQMQARCFQLILFNIFVLWYYLPTNKLGRYKEMCVNFYKEKMQYFENLIDEYLKKAEKSRLSRLL